MLVAALTSVGCTGAKMGYNLPPSQQLMEPGPGVGGPGPGVIPAPGQVGVGGNMGAMQASYVEDAAYCQPSGGACYAGCPAPAGMGMPATSQISFLGEEPLQISWDVSSAGMFDSSPLFVPGKQDFSQGAIYRLKVTNLPGRESVTLYPTLEVAPVTPRTDAYLAHAAVPVQFTEEDFDQVLSGNFVTKVIYLPDPEFTEVALAGVETLVSTRLDPGVDPVAEADRRGSILAILRMGSKDLGLSSGAPSDGSIMPAQFEEGQMMDSPEHVPAPMEGEYVGEYMGETYPVDSYYDGQGYAGANSMPLGAPTAGMMPNPVPPHMVANMAPAWGMPMSGTPIGLPGPPHIPLGSPAGLQKHTMTNRTRMVMPGPTQEFNMTVNQRPGMNYPAPVNNVRINEVNRAPVQAFGGTVPGPVPSALNKSWFKFKSMFHKSDCE
ncbi:hypothetical protein Pan181_20710 [Aeoliella mucimassa]|uniref:Uncharacterized protein n=2 Tax=Aeoliella mucimassa TaxID=2527972 RepID=A0A518AMC3_9BACT|nr:hypothetical protein Pan181_20710 [Aeoliella mucimassa]